LLKKRRGNKRIKYIVFLLAVAFLICNFTISACAEDDLQDKGSIIDEQADTYEIKDLNDRLEDIDPEFIYNLLGTKYNDNLLADIAKGKIRFDFNQMTRYILGIIFKEVKINLEIMIKLVIVCMLYSFLKTIQSSFMGSNILEIGFFACYVVVVSIILISLGETARLGLDAISKMIDFMFATIPILLGLLSAGGNIVSSGIFKPIIVMMAEVCAVFMRNFFIPLIMFASIISIVNNVSDKIQLSRLSSFLKQICLWVLAFIMTAFMAVLSVQGSVGSVADGIAGKTAKTAIGFIPVAGKYLADATDTVFACAMLIKNAAGIAVMIGILGICIMPMLKITAIICVYKITCILVEPITDKRITESINECANAASFILGIAACVTFMFILAVTVMIGAANASLMIR